MTHLPFGRPAIRPLGIAELRRVEQELLGYLPGEVAHVENVMAGEARERVHRSLELAESVLEVEEQRESESSRDLESTERFEVEQEMRAQLQEQESFQVGVNISASYGPFFTLGANTSYGTSTTREEEQRNATRYAKELTERASERVREAVRERRVTTLRQEVEETNSHRFSNDSDAGRAGVYRWLDKRYRFQVTSYGRRLLFEFYVPEPASHLRYARATVPGAGPPPRPSILDPATGAMRPLQPDLVTRDNYLALAGEHGVGQVPPPPARFQLVELPLARAKDPGGGRNTAMRFALEQDLELPEGYRATWAYFRALMHSDAVVVVGTGYAADPVNWASLHGVVGRHEFHPHLRLENPFVASWWMPDERGSVSVAISGLMPAAVTLVLQIFCTLDDEHFEAWQLDVFGRVMAAHRQHLLEYRDEQAARRGGVPVTGRPPAENQEIMRTELQRVAMDLWLGGSDVFPPAVSFAAGRPEVDQVAARSATPLAAFLADAFEWDAASTVLLPYHFAPAARWPTLLAEDDPDPAMRRFLQAGAARVWVPVRTQATAAVLWAQATGEIWDGDDAPTFTPDSPEAELLALLTDLEDDTGLVDIPIAAAPGDEAGTWEVDVPTSLVWLQPDSTLPEP